MAGICFDCNVPMLKTKSGFICCKCDSGLRDCTMSKMRVVNDDGLILGSSETVTLGATVDGKEIYELYHRGKLDLSQFLRTASGTIKRFTKKSPADQVETQGGRERK